MCNEPLGRIDMTKHRAKLTQKVRLLNSACYGTGPKARRLDKSEIGRKMLRVNVIELAQTAWRSPTLFGQKKHASLRFCNDYRNLNAVTMKETYLVLRIKDSLD